LLFLNKLIVKFVKILPKFIVKIFAQKYIAGLHLEDAVNVIRGLNAKGILGTVDVLGEAIKNKSETIEAKKEYLEVIETIQSNNLAANLSVKPTQMGIVLDKEFGFKQIADIVEKAKEYKNFVRLDMEDSSVTELTFELLSYLKQKFDNVGVVVQAYLKRSFDDVVRLNKERINYRLCKGIYDEPESIAYKNRLDIRNNFLKILKIIFESGNYVGIATHDDYLVKNALQLIEELNIPKDKYEFQMLYGVKENLRDKINAAGHKIRIYIPFGEHWYAYSIRRLQENPQLAWYITKSIFTFR
jgi:proline dehydrogenase